MRRLLPLLAFLAVAAGPPAVDAEQLFQSGRQREAFEMVERGAAAGDVDSIDRLGWFYDNGYVVARDDVRAAALYRRAADGGNAHAQWRLGVMLDLGEGVASNPEEAVQWFRRAVAQGDAAALTSLAVMHATGRGVPQDFAEARRLYREAARLGEPHGFYGVGVLHILGQGVPRDPVEGFAWLAVSASLGDEEAEAMMARLDLEPQDLERAVARANEIVRETGVDAPRIVLGDGKDEAEEAEEPRPVPVV